MTALVRTATATRMAFRDQVRRPLLVILLVIVPAYVITRSIADTEATPRRITLPGGDEITTTMRDLHGAVMAGTTIAFVAALVGVFVMQSALAGDRRLVVAGYRAGETIAARVIVVAAATLVVVATSAAITALYFTPASWGPLLAALVLTGVIYAAIGALVGAVLDRLAATYLMLFVVMTDLGVVQNPMFGDGRPDGWAVLLPGYGPARMMVDGGFSDAFHAGGALMLSLAWVAGLSLAVTIVLRRAVGSYA
ncbi:MAG TPA: ABC transporter permease [Acidimicrobiia bacterium]